MKNVNDIFLHLKEKIVHTYVILSDKEKIFAIFTILGLFYGILVLPLLLGAYDYKEENLAYYAKQVALKDKVEKVAKTAKVAKKKAGQESLLSVVSSSAPSYGLTLTRYQLNPDRSVMIHINDQPFNLLMRWMDFLYTKGFSLQSIRLDTTKGEKTGLVDARLTMQ